MPEILITKMRIVKNAIEISEAKIIDENGNPSRTVAINQSFAVALKGSIIDLDLSHLNNETE
tara:strand:- start:144 stop:329 length:186 start_codon:yes stop_codon:yes gene_type:complete